METKPNDTKIKQNTKKYEDYLDSDDEFPDECNEVPNLPVYKNDNRFDKIIFKWINNQESYNLKSNVPLDTTDASQDSFSDDSLNKGLVIKNGFLSKHDLFCLKSIEEFTCDSTFMWLLHFLVYKDVHSRYMFLKSCLVSTFHNDIYHPIKKSNSSLIQTKKKYKLLIKI